MTYQRRTFLKTAAATALSAGVFSAPRPLLAAIGSRSIPIPAPDDARLKELVQTALDAARTAGATYTDVRLSHTYRRKTTIRPTTGFLDREEVAVGVRTLVDGYWGFAASPIWSTQEMARLAKSAAAISKANTAGKARVVDLAPVTPVRDGHWMTPVAIDPFDVHPMEFFDYLRGLASEATELFGVSFSSMSTTFRKQDRIFGSSEGSYYTQRLYRSEGTLIMKVGGKDGVDKSISFLTPTGIGMELYWGRDMIEELRQLREDGLQDLALPMMPIEVGRYDTVLDGASMGTLTGATIGTAVEIDRALGYEANGVGTSYLNDPLEMLGTLQVAAPVVSISANRNETGGASTVQWDDEGVETASFPLITNGKLTDFQAMREGGGWLKDSDARLHRAVRSRGCATCSSAINAPVTGAANIVMASGQNAPDLDGLTAGLESGLLIRNANIQVDFQCLNGMLAGDTYQIRKGKRVARIFDAGILFRAPEIWKGVTAIGGTSSLQRQTQYVDKGEPQQSLEYSVTAPAALIKNTTVIDVRRRA